jgi:hypothetical protein
VEEDDLSQVHSFRTVPVVEVESHFLRVAVHLWESNCVPALQIEVQLLVRNLMPSSLQQVKRMDMHFRW